VAILPVAVAREELQRDQSVEEIVAAARMEPQDVAQLSSCHRPVAEDREEVEFDRREQYL
jgi:hypothetical protein